MKTLPVQLATEIDEINSWMFPVGSQLKIVEMTGYCQGFVSLMLSKKRFPTEEFLKAARKVAAENAVRFGHQPLMKVG